MSSIPSTTEQPAGHLNRRTSPRERYKELVYVDLGHNNGGMLLNVSEGGIGFQAIQPVAQGQPIQVEFTLPGIGDPIEATGRIVWLNDTGICGGLQFVNLSPVTRHTLARGLALCTPNDSMELEISLPPAAPEANPRSPSPTDHVMATQVAQPGPIAPSGLGSSQAARLRPDDVPAADQLALPASGALASRGTPRPQRRDEIVPDSTPAHAHKRDLTNPQPKEQIQSGEIPRPSLQTIPITFIVASGCFVLLATIAGMLFFRFGLSRAAPLPTNPAQAQTSTPAQPAAQQPATGAPAQTFQIEVVESNNKRWALIPGNEAASGGRDQSAPQRIQQSVPVKSQKKEAAKIQRWTPPALRIPQRSPVSGESLREGSVALLGPAAHPLPGVSGPPSALVNPRAVIPASPDSALAQQGQTPSAGNQPAVLVKRVEPVYSTMARHLHLEGPVQVSAVIGQDGTPRNLKLVSGNMILGQLALDAIQQWRYKPSTLHGVPIEQPAVITVIFRFVQ